MSGPEVGAYAWGHRGHNGVVFHRLAEPIRVARAEGIRAELGYVLDDEILDRHNTVIAQMLHEPRASNAWEALAQLGTHRLVLDVDDAMWSPDYHVFRQHYDAEALALLRRNVEISHVVTTPSEVLAEQLAQWNANVHVVPNTVPAFVLDIGRGPRPEQPIVGYQGSTSHLRDWPLSQRAALAKFLVQADWRAHFFGPDELPPGWNDGPLAGRVAVSPWKAPGSPEYYGSLSRVDVGIGPLRDSAFNRGKSALRAIEYAALGIVPVLPDLPPYRGWVDNHVTGRLVRTHETLRAVLSDVARYPDVLDKMSANARDAASRWTTEHNIGRWIEAWNSQS